VEEGVATKAKAEETISRIRIEAVIKGIVEGTSNNKDRVVIRAIIITSNSKATLIPSRVITNKEVMKIEDEEATIMIEVVDAFRVAGLRRADRVTINILIGVISGEVIVEDANFSALLFIAFLLGFLHL
jgi:hypothetical protein